MAAVHLISLSLYRSEILALFMMSLLGNDQHAGLHIRQAHKAPKLLQGNLPLQVAHAKGKQV